MVGKSYGKSQQGGDGGWDTNKSITDSIIIPEGYGLNRVTAAVEGSSYYNSVNAKVSVTVADANHKFNVFNSDNPSETWHELFKWDSSTNNSFENFSNEVPVAVGFELMWYATVGITLELRRKVELFEEWQLDTFNAIMNAYEKELQKHRESVAEVQAFQGRILEANPAYYREIESTILKKNCIAYMIGHENMGSKHISGSTFSSLQVNNTQEMDKYASRVKFFEQAFEWSIMSYKFYPFYWAGRERWHEMYNYDNGDPIFRDFMRSGMARVFVTVRPGFEKAVMYYMNTGQIWNGAEAPSIDEPLFLSIVQELEEPEGTVIDTWTTRVPSSLVLLQKDSISLNAAGLPCWCDTGTPPTESIDNDTTSLASLIVPQL